MNLREKMEAEVDHARTRYQGGLRQAISVLESAQKSLDKHDSVNSLGVLQVTGTTLEALAGAFAQAKHDFEMVCDFFDEHGGG